MNAPHVMQDHLQQTLVISQRRSQKTHEHAASRTKRNTANESTEAASQARERQEEARLLYEQTCQEIADAETLYKGATKSTLWRLRKSTSSRHSWGTPMNSVLNYSRRALHEPVQPSGSQVSLRQKSGVFDVRPNGVGKRRPRSIERAPF